VHIRWKKVQLKSNRQSGEHLCRHKRVKHPVTLTPILVSYEKGKYQTLHRIGPSIRECCCDFDDPKTYRARASFWIEVERRFRELEGQLSLDERSDFLKIKEVLILAINTIVPKPPSKSKWSYTTWSKKTKAPQRARARRGPLPTPKNEGTLEEWCAVLGVATTVTAAELKSVWRKLALQHHPDRGGDPQEFMRYQTAYEKARGAVEERA